MCCSKTVTLITWVSDLQYSHFAVNKTSALYLHHRGLKESFTQKRKFAETDLEKCSIAHKCNESPSSW